MIYDGVLYFNNSPVVIPNSENVVTKNVKKKSKKIGAKLFDINTSDYKKLTSNKRVETIQLFDKLDEKILKKFNGIHRNYLMKEVVYKTNVRLMTVVIKQNELIINFDKSAKDYDTKNLLKERAGYQNQNILFVGSSGVGKTHLAISLGIAAAKKRYLTYFISCHDLIMQLKKAHAENRLEQRLKQFCKYRLLIIDEIGYLPVDRDGANLFFQLIAKRYEESSTIITTNQPFSKWGEVFSDNTLANAILDRLLHHSSIIKITGPSYRLKGKIEEMESRVKNS